MNVEELIKQLQELPKDAKVFTRDEYGCITEGVWFYYNGEINTVLL